MFKFARIIKQKMSDGSVVYNVGLRASGDDHDSLVLCATTHGHAAELARTINNCADVEHVPQCEILDTEGRL
jgi:hypothetical protein